ncbi:putative protein TPRXL [Patiria miniata]|uniref:Uncharacterized protein n=1 Tax=Patiria miniata TaxID=46514 RepID=A0A913ZWJ3_PATMI|nr:putative protein TPRXL [Patiria miniata]
MSVAGHNRDVLVTSSLSSMDSGRDHRPLTSKTGKGEDSSLSFYMGDVGSSLPNMSKTAKKLSRSSDSQSSSFYNSPDMSPKTDQVFKFDLIGPGSKKIGYTVCTSSSTSKLLQRPKPKPVVSLSGDSSPTGPHKFLRESRSLDREDETDRFPEPRRLQRQETFDSSASSVQALQDKITNNNLGRPPLRTAKSFDFGYQSANGGDSQNSLQPPSGSDTLQVISATKAAPSPATKRRINYFQKLASSVLSGSRSSSSGPSSPRERKSTSSSEQSLSGVPSSPDHTSSDEGGFNDTFSPPSSPTVMQKGRQSSSPSSKFMPKKIWRTKSKPQATTPTVTSLWNPEKRKINMACRKR